MAEYREKLPTYTVDIVKFKVGKKHPQLAPGVDDNGPYGMLYALDGHKKARDGWAVITYPDGKVDVQEWDVAMSVFEPVAAKGSKELPEKTDE